MDVRVGERIRRNHRDRGGVSLENMSVRRRHEAQRLPPSPFALIFLRKKNRLWTRVIQFAYRIMPPQKNASTPKNNQNDRCTSQDNAE